MTPGQLSTEIRIRIGKVVGATGMFPERELTEAEINKIACECIGVCNSAFPAEAGQGVPAQAATPPAGTEIDPDYEAEQGEAAAREGYTTDRGTH